MNQIWSEVHLKRLRSRLIGIDQGGTVLFSSFENDCEMWTGRGQRERRRLIKFSEPLDMPPNVQTSVSFWDMVASIVIRADDAAEAAT